MCNSTFINIEGDIEQCILSKFKKKADFIEKLNAQVKRKEMMNSIGAEKSLKTSLTGTSSIIPKGKSKWLYFCGIFFTVIVSIFICYKFYSNWRIKKQIEAIELGE